MLTSLRSKPKLSVSRRNGSTGLGEDVKAMPRAQGDRGKWDHIVAGNQAESESLSDRCQHQIRFHKSEGIADALAGTVTEGKVGEPRIAFEQVPELPTFGNELLRVFVPARISMHDP